MGKTKQRLGYRSKRVVLEKFLTAHRSPARETFASRELCAYFSGRFVHVEFLFGNIWEPFETKFQVGDKVWTAPPAWMAKADADGTRGALERLISRVDAACQLLAAPAAWPAPVLARLYDFLQRHCDLLVLCCEPRGSGPLRNFWKKSTHAVAGVERGIVARVLTGISTVDKNSPVAKISNLLARSLGISSANKAFVAFTLEHIKCDVTCGFMRETLWRTLVGAFRGAWQPVGIRVFVTLARVRHMPLEEFRTSVAKNLAEKSFPLFIAVMHEAVVRTLEEDGVVIEALRRQFGERWDGFAAAVRSACDALREVATECFYEAEVDAGEAIAQMHRSRCPSAAAFVKTYRRLPKVSFGRNPWRAPCAIFLKRLTALDPGATEIFGKQDFGEGKLLASARACLRKASPGARKIIRGAVATEDAWRKELQSPRAAEDVRDAVSFLGSLGALLGLRFVRLPAAIAKLQSAAVSRRFLRDGLSPESFEQASDFMCCFKCRSVKNFFVAKPGKRAKDDLSKACGYRGVALADDGRLVCQSHRPRHQSGTCGHVGLQTFPLLRGTEARAVIFFDACYLIAPCCGHLCSAEALLPTGEGLFLCAHCRRPPQVKRKRDRHDGVVCAYCGEHVGSGGRGVVIGEEGASERKHLCKLHSRKWLSSKKIWGMDELKEKLAVEGFLRTESGTMKKHLYT